MHTDNCVSEPELARFVLGDLDAKQLHRIAAHVGDCAPCQETVVAIAEQTNTFVEAIQAAGARAPVRPRKSFRAKAVNTSSEVSDAAVVELYEIRAQTD